MGYFNTGTGNHFSALLVSPMALRLAIVDRNPFQPYCLSETTVGQFAISNMELIYLTGCSINVRTVTYHI